MSTPAVGIFGLTGCAGDQLVILNCEDQLLDIVAAVDLRDFATASSAGDTACNLDVALVEGAVVSPLDASRLARIRERSRILVAVGTCAVWGGVAAPSGAKALRESVKVDLNVTGCPIEKDQILAALASLLHGDPPLALEYPVCAECKMRENNCLLIGKGEVCCGPLTAAGCDARCPGLGVACVGCRGPASDANYPSALAMFSAAPVSRDDVARKLATFAPEGVRP